MSCPARSRGAREAAIVSSVALLRLASVVAIALGALLLAGGVKREIESHRRAVTDMQKPILMVAGFRIAIIGLCLIGLGAGVLLGLTWLWVLALIIAGEETLETSIVVSALRDGERRKARRAAANRRDPSA